MKVTWSVYMKPSYQPTKSHITRLTITPQRVTVKVAQDYSERDKQRLGSFVDYVLEQFVDICSEWRGEVKFQLDGVYWASVVLRSGNRTRKYEAIL